MYREVVWTYVVRKDGGYIGRRMLTMELPGKRKRGRLKEVCGCGERGHDSSGINGGRRGGENRMETEYPLWRPLTGAAERRRRTTCIAIVVPISR